MHISGMFEDSLFHAKHNKFSHKWSVTTADAASGNEYVFEADALQMAAIFALMFTGGESLGIMEDYCYKIAEPLMPTELGDGMSEKIIADGRRLIP